MILTIIFVAMLIIGIVIVFYDSNYSINEGLSWFGLSNLLIGFGATLGSLVIIIVSHMGVVTRIEQNNITYNSLTSRLEIIQSDYEDISKSDVIKDISEWNKQVVSAKYWTYNPWTSWFYSKEVIDNLKTIDYPGLSGGETK